MRYSSRSLMTFAVASVFLCFAASAQKKKPAAPPSPSAAAAPPVKSARSLLSFDEYEHVLNLIFPIDHAVPLGVDYTMVLRFEPLSRPESQLVIRRWHDGRVEANLYRVEKGTAWQAAYGHDEGKNPDFPGIVKDIPLRQNSVLVSPHQVDEWHAEIFPLLQKQYAHVRTMDKHIVRTGNPGLGQGGARYELWFLQPDDETHVVSWDADTDVLPTGVFPLAKWMNLIRFHAEGHALPAKPPLEALKTPAQPAR